MAGPTEEVVSTVEFPGDFRHVEWLRCLVERMLAVVTADSELAIDVAIAVDEAVANVIVHSYAGMAGMLHLGLRIRLPVAAQPGELVVVIEDRGEGGHRFDPDTWQPDNEAEGRGFRTGGFGLVLIGRIMDEMRYRVEPEGTNVLTLRKLLPVARLAVT